MSDGEGSFISHLEALRGALLRCVTVTAALSDKTSRKVTTAAAIEYDLASLELDSEGKFTEAKEYTLKISFAGVSTELTFTVSEA